MNFEKENLPKHIAIIMDGNRRWAKKQGKPAAFGHKAGAKTLEKIVRYANKIGIEHITVYAFSTENWKRAEDKHTVNEGKQKIMILGGGPNRIGQGIEFDYCCVHAALALKKLGFETIIVNCNPETVSTDYDTSDRLYFEPLTLEDVLSIYNKEKPVGVIAQFGGQTPLNLAADLEKNGVKILGTAPAV